MDNSKQNHSHEIIPSLIKAIDEHELAGFDSTEEERDDVNKRLKSIGFSPFNNPIYGIEDRNVLSKQQRTQSMSISMPPSPLEAHLHNSKRVLFTNKETILGSDFPSYISPPHSNLSSQTKPAKFYSHQIPKGSIINEVGVSMKSANLPPRNPRINKLKDKRYDSFKTWSGKLERMSTFRGKRRENDEGSRSEKAPEIDKNVPVHRYFDALEGPELDTLRASEEEILLPEDKRWPFLLRFQISSFGICLGVSSQAIMWKTLATSPSTSFLHITPYINLVLWFVSVALVSIVSIIYALKIIFYFEAVRREYYHPIRINFFFAPWIALLFLALGVPSSITKTLHHSLWYILMTPIVCLELKIYGQWMSGGQRRLSKVANPSNHLSVVGNFVGALLGASMGLKEGPIFFFAVGLAHYTVLFVTLYQRLPTNETLPKELHPVFFLFVAAPSVASMAWARIQGSFDHGSRIAYFIALFLYFSLAVRVNFFRGIKFSLAWWAYTFPMTGAAIATIRYTNVVTNPVTKTLTVVLCIVSTLTVSALLATTIVHAFVLRDLFPNDMAIAISDRRPKPHHHWFHRRHVSADPSIENFLKYSDSNGKDIEASIDHQDCKNGDFSDSPGENEQRDQSQ